MSKVYVVEASGDTREVEMIHCHDEDKELQLILERNPDLIPGDQIDPVDPRRWLQIKREMPVPDPNTGETRWSIDFLFADQYAMPTFIECKRFDDTRSRREVVGQMLEYAANGHYYWTKDVLRDFAEATLGKPDKNLEEEIQKLNPEEYDSANAFFERMEDNLRQGQLRLVFFLEEAPMELKSVVDFLNKQMERSEVLLVEARQYRHADLKMIVPTLFGYTEEARLVKRTVSVTKKETKKWDRASFFEEIGKRLESAHVSAIESLFNECEELGSVFLYGSGKVDGSFSAKWPQISEKTILTVYTNGILTLNFTNLNSSGRGEKAKDILKKLIANKVGLEVPEDYEKRYVGYKIDIWSQKVEQVIEALREIVGSCLDTNFETDGLDS